MTAFEDRTVDDEALLAQWFDQFLEDVLEGRATDLEALVEQRPDLAARIHESYLLAHQLAGRRLPTTPRIEGYEIEREIGRGGMGAVFLARHVELDRQVALKVLPSSFGLSDRARQRFLNEARALAQVSDDHIVRIYNVIANDEALAFEMEFVDGPSLRDVLDAIRAKGRDATVSDVVAILGDPAARPPERTYLQWCVRVVATIARALGKVHRAGLVHRDVKPSNILLQRDGTPLLADFGLVRDLASSATHTGAFVGTLSYASPEQLRAEGADSDARSDVYSLGATLWELIAGSPPIEGRSSIEVLERIAKDGGAPRLRRVLPDAPRDLETILEKAMDPDPAERYQTVDALADDLDLLLRWRPIGARPPGALRRARKSLRRHRRVILGGLVGAALVVGAIAIPFLLGQERERRAREAERFVGVAHEQLLSRRIRDRLYRILVLGRRMQPERITELSAGDTEGLAAALDAYDRAIALAPDRPDVAVERAIVRIAAGGSPMGEPVDIEMLPRAARVYAEPWARGDVPLENPKLQLDSASTADRHAIGMLAFLVGDLTNCEAAWSGLDPISTGAPLTDAGLGLLYAIDGQPERAYPRLLQASRSFPDNALLATTLAGVAVALGDLDLAERWIRRGRELGGDPFGIGTVEADDLAARGEPDAARTVLEGLDEGDHRVVLRLAMLDRQAGDDAAAARRLQELLRGQPRMVRARLELARAALASGDRPGYLAQVEWVVGADYGRGRSAGSVRDAIEILRLGGLHGLVERAWRMGRNGTARPLRGWTDATFTKAAFADPGLIEELVLRRESVRRDVETWFPHAPKSERTGRVADLIARGIATWTWYPELGLGTDPAIRFGSLHAGMAARLWWPLIAQAVLPQLIGYDEGVTEPEDHTVFALDADADGDQLGGVGTAGDIDGDGIADFVIGSLRNEPGPEDYTRLVSGADGSVLHEIRGPAVGRSGAVVGDLDGDGQAEFAHARIEAGEQDGPEAIVQIRSLADGRIVHTLRDPERTPEFGRSILGLGDIDGDGRNDFCIATPGALGGVGLVRCYSGSSATELYTLRGTVGGSFGCAIASVGDRDDDGVRDLLVGAFSAEGTAGRAYLFSGRTGDELTELRGEGESRMFGASVASGGDVDGDGVEDYLIGAGAREAGCAFLLSGRDGATLWAAGAWKGRLTLGWAVALCDLDGDGIADPIVTSAMADTTGRDSGLLRAWSGRSIREGRTEVQILEVRGRGPGDLLGGGLLALPDHFGPGFGALVVSAPGRRDAWTPSGRVWLLSPVLEPDEALARLRDRR